PNYLANHQVEYRIRRKTGGWCWLLSHFRACAFNEFGRPTRLLGIDFDITEQRQRQADLSEARAQVADAARRAKIAFWRQQPSPKPVVWSEAAGEIVGQGAAGLPATTEDFLSLVHPEDAERVKAIYAQARAGAKAFNLEYRIVQPDGAVTWLH